MDQLTLDNWDCVKQRFLSEKNGSEWKDLCYYLMYLWHAKIIPIPLRVAKKEPPLPDFQFDFLQEATMGFEHTRATTPNMKHADAKCTDDELIELSFCGHQKHSDDIVNRAIKDKGQRLESSGYGDYGREKVWVECVIYAIQQKIQKNYSGFNYIELLIVDTETPVVHVREKIALSMLHDKLIKIKDANKFTKIHIMNVSRLLYDLTGERQCIQSTEAML